MDNELDEIKKIDLGSYENVMAQLEAGGYMWGNTNPLKIDMLKIHEYNATTLEILERIELHALERIQKGRAERVLRTLRSHTFESDWQAESSWFLENADAEAVFSRGQQVFALGRLKDEIDALRFAIEAAMEDQD